METNQPFDPLQAMLSQMNHADPQVRQLIEQQIRASQERKKQQETNEETLRRFRIQNKRLMDQISAMKAQSKQNKEEQDRMVNCLDYFLKLNNSLAAALGSCDNCWGEDQNCEKCNGDGLPGWREVNKRLFNIYVQPCLEKIYGSGRNSGNGATTMN
jgi:hypothetical protein